MKKLLTILFILARLWSYPATYYVSPAGSDASNGDISHPFATLSKAWLVVVPGDLIYVRGGTYVLTSTTNQNLSGKSGTASNLIKIWAYPCEVPVFSYATTAFSTASNGIRLGSSNYIHIKGIRVTSLRQVSGGQVHTGIYLSGSSNNIIENCEVDRIGGYGFVINNSNNNLILNCDSHHNADPYTVPAYDGANGFMITSSGNTSTGNTFKGCRAWWNSDDGFDFYASPGNVTIDNCWSFWNGYIGGTFVTAGNGTGFKLGPTALSEPTIIRKTVRNCLAYANRTVGFARNSAKHAFVLYNNVAYLNKEGGFNFYNLPGIANIVRNNISYANLSFNTYFDTGATVDHNSFQGGTNDVPNPVYNVTNADFVSINSVGIDGARQADGSLPILTFLRLVTGSDLINTGINVGIPYNGTAPDLGCFEY
jgi:parallel beta-helix repeat protein